MPPRHGHSLIRLQLWAQNNPDRYAMRAGAVGGVLMASMSGFIAYVITESWTVAVLAGAVVAPLFATALYFFVRRSIRSLGEGPSVDADPVRVRAAHRLVRTGRPSDDADLDELAAVTAEQGMRATRPASPLAIVWIVVLVSSSCSFVIGIVGTLPDDGAMHVIRGLLPVLCAFQLVLLVVQRMRSRRFLRAFEERRRPIGGDPE